MKLVKSSLLVKLVILILVVYATVTLVSLRKQITEKNEQEAILNSSIAATQQENNRIQDSIDALGTDAGVEAVARDKLGMVDEGDIVFYDVGEWRQTIQTRRLCVLNRIKWENRTNIWILQLEQLWKARSRV